MRLSLGLHRWAGGSEGLRLVGPAELPEPEHVHRSRNVERGSPARMQGQCHAMVPVDLSAHSWLGSPR